MESNRVVTRVAVWIYAAIGLAAIGVALLGYEEALLAWLFVPVVCLVGVLLQFVAFGPLMLITAWLFGGRGQDRRADQGAAEDV